MVTKRDRQEAAQLVRRVLHTVEQGEIEADTQVGQRFRRRLEGAVIGLEADNALAAEEGENQVAVVERDETGV